MNTLAKISAAFPFKSHYASVLGSKMHYIEQGSGDPVLFLHGIPASSYLWRNVIPELSSKGRCIAPDLIGMGKSDKPDITYRIFDHIKYIDAFIDTLKLRNITLVLHGLGSIIGFDYAMRHPKNVSRIVFYEAYIGELHEWKKMSLPLQQLSVMFQNKEASQKAILADTNLIKKMFMGTSLRKLTKEELEVYNAPFLKSQDRVVLWQYIQDSPFGLRAKDVAELISNYTKYLEKSSIPKLLLYNIPGFITTMGNIEWCRKNLPNLTVVDLHEGLHFAQEYNPQEFGYEISKWMTRD